MYIRWNRRQGDLKPGRSNGSDREKEDFWFLDDGGSAVGVGGVCLYVSGCACGLRANVGVEHRWASVVGVGKDAFR